MLRISSYYFYQVGAAIRPLKELDYKSSNRTARQILYSGKNWLEDVLGQAGLRLKTSNPKGQELLKAVNDLLGQIDAKQDALDEELGFFDAFYIRSIAQEYETQLSAELQFSDLYLVTRKGGFDTTELAERGESIFPSNLPTKVPEAILDARQAARCLAFELPTAAGFHLHRANEAVLHRYYDVVTNGQQRPANRSIGSYIHELNKKNAGDAKVIAGLQSIKDLHRNPLIHPEESLDSVEEAIALHGAIQSVMVHMLKVIPDAPVALLPAAVVNP